MIRFSHYERTDRTSIPRLAAITALLLATPSIAACPIGYAKPTCYSVQSEVSYALGGVAPRNNSSYGDTAQMVSTTGPQALTGAAGASSSPLHNGTIDVSAVTESAGWHADAEADLSYSFQIVALKGGVLPALIPILVSASATSYRDGPYVDELAQLTVSQDGVQKLIAQGHRPDGRELNIFSVSQYVSFDPSKPVSVFMLGLVDAFATGGFDRKVDRVVVDPTFVIDPAFAADYQLVGLPDGTGGVGGVPEPGMWALMIAGFGAVGSTLRSRRSRAFRSASHE